MDENQEGTQEETIEEATDGHDGLGHVTTPYEPQARHGRGFRWNTSTGKYTPL